MKSYAILAIVALSACRVGTLEIDPETHDGDGDGVVLADDCNDADATMFPGADELCDGIDNNCNGSIDEADPTNDRVLYTDADGDGFGDENSPVAACAAFDGVTDVTGDCDDSDARYNPDAVEDDCEDLADYNCDGVLSFEDGDDDGFIGCLDCNDTDPTVNPDADEVCNGVDDDCDGERDNDAIDVGTFYADADGDGYGDPDALIEECFRPSGTSETNDDCDDSSPTVHPNATERCNGTDDDCNGLVDDDSLDANRWYADADDDGYGDPAGDSVVACDRPLGFVGNIDDCDDTDASVSPAGVESCNGIDDDCEGGVDEDFDQDGDGVTSCGGDCDDTRSTVRPGAVETCNDLDDDCNGTVDDEAVDRIRYFVDTDQDGWGDARTPFVLACSAPQGRVSNGSDCDDSNDSVYPLAPEQCNGIDDNCAGGIDEGFDQDGDGATSCGGDCDDTNPTRREGLPEVCNGQDDDCDGLVDDADDDRTGGVPTYTDADGDQFGDAATETLQCDLTPGQVRNAGDCDDTNALVNPGRDERCNDRDDDCDGLVDEDPINGTVYFADTDGDGFGDADAPGAPTCDAGPGYTDDTSDCDDDDALVFPGADEQLNGYDDDCDTLVDEGQPYGSGSDGPLTVATTVDLSTWTSPGRPGPDAMSWPLAAIEGATLIVEGSTTALAPGDEVLVVNVHGSDSRHDNVGAWTTATVAQVTADRVALTEALDVIVGNSSNDDLTGQDILVQRIPHYTTVTVASGGAIVSSPWNGRTGGYIALRASESVTVLSGGSIDASELGYAGGATGGGDNCDSFQGESWAGRGEGRGNGSCNAYNEATGQWAPNYGGGGAHICGGGGEYAGGATASVSWNGGSATPAAAGLVYGQPALTQLLPGSGGGGVWDGTPGNPGPGGDGGGVVYVASPVLTVQSGGSVVSNGGTPPHWAIGTWTYGAGGGAGGAIYLVAGDMDLAAGSLFAEGGFGYDDVIRPAGDGGMGRVRLDFERFRGNTTPSDSALDSVSEPDPGFISLP